jgi:hypothetical protein
MLIGARRRGARAHAGLVVPLLVIRPLISLANLINWSPAGRANKALVRLFLIQSVLAVLALAAAVVFVVLIGRNARAVRVKPRPERAAAALDAHAAAMIARLAILVASALLLLAAVGARSLGMIKLVAFGGPLLSVAASAVMLAATARYAWASVDPRPAAHVAVALFAATLAIDVESFVMVAGMFWGKGDFSERAELLMRLAPALELVGQAVGVAAVIALLVSLAGVGRERRVHAAGRRALWIGSSMAVLVVIAAVIRRSAPPFGAGAAGGLLVFGGLLLIGAIVVFMAYVGLVRETGRALAVAAVTPATRG